MRKAGNKSYLYPHTSWREHWSSPLSKTCLHPCILYLNFPDKLTSHTNPIIGVKEDNNYLYVQLWIHVGLLAICLIIISYYNNPVYNYYTISYGTHDKGDSKFPRIPACILFTINDHSSYQDYFSLHRRSRVEREKEGTRLLEDEGEKDWGEIWYILYNLCAVL